MLNSFRKWSAGNRPAFVTSLVILFIFSVPVKAGTLTGAYQTVPQFSQVNLTQIGAIDWVHWGTFTEFAFDRKEGVPPLISNYTLLGSPIADFGPFQYSDNYNGYTWSDGFPTLSATNTTTGIYLLGRNDGYQFTVPADTTTRVLKVYVGAYGAGATFNASLSDGGSYTSTAVTYAANGPAGLYTLTYAGASSNQTLTVKFTLTTVRDRNFGNVTLQAAALYYASSNNPPTVTIANPAPNTAFSSGSPITIAANPFDKEGPIASVQFFDDTNFLGETFSSPFAITWTNANIGQHVLTARAFDTNGASYVSHRTPVFVTASGGTLTAAVTNTSTSIFLNDEGTRDWSHWGLNTASSFDHKAGVAPFLPTLQLVGTNTVQRNLEDLTYWSWTGGTPNASATDSTTGVLVNGHTNGFELQLPAGTNTRTAKIYVGLYGARGQLQAYLTDFSAPVITDTQQRLYDKLSETYTFSYSAASENQKLIVRYTTDSLFDFTFGYLSLLSSAAVAAPSTVSILAPTNNTTMDVSTRILIQANASNRDGPITSVKFYHDGQLIDEVTNAPFRVIWSNAVTGPVNLQAIATDVFGGQATSAPVALTFVTNFPSPLKLLAPQGGDVFVAGTNLTLQAAADPEFAAHSVEFFSGGASLGQVFGPPFSLVWTNLAVGIYTLTAIGTDNANSIVSSFPATIAVDPNKPPSVTVTTPTNGSVFHWSEPVTLTATASDKDGFITLLQVFDGETKLTECTNSPCTIVLSNSSSQVYSLTARAADNWLATSTSAPVIVTITNLPPIVTLNSPTNGALVWTAIPLLLHSVASDPDGTIQQVKFFEGTNLLGAVTNAPFDWIWSNTVAGPFTFTTIATDNDGATTTSAPVTITVSNPPPFIAITNPIANVSFAKFTNINIETLAGDLNGAVTNVAFFQGTNLLANVSNAPFNFLWTNVAPGNYVLSAQAFDSEGASSSSAPVPITVLNSSLTGDVLGSFQNIPEGTEVNLSKEGPLDWIHWGTYTEFAFDRKAGVAPVLKDYSLLGSPLSTEGPFQFGDNAHSYTWWDGMPDTVVSNTTTGISLSGLNHGFQLTVPSDTTPRILKVYVGVTAADATLSAYLSDGSGFASTEVNEATNGHTGFYTIHYISASSNQTLTVKYQLTSVRDPNLANITLQAAALSYETQNNPPTAALVSPTPNTSFTTGDPISITVAAFDSDGSITNVGFYAGTNLLGTASAAPYTFLWSNAPPGLHPLSVLASDNQGSSYRSRSVEVFVSGGNGLLTGNISSTPASVVLSAEGSRDWAHWGKNGVTSFDHKSGVPTFFQTFLKLGTNIVTATDDSTAWSWIGGTPSLNASNSMTGVFIGGYTNGFELQLPASTNLRTAKIYVGLASARGRLQAFLNDSSAPAFTDTSLASFYGNSSGAFTFNYAAGSNNQKLIVRYVADSIFDATAGGVTLLSATATALSSSVTITSPADASSVDCSHPPQIQATASNPDGTVTSVSFYRDGSFLGRITNAPYNLTWTNGIPGSYILTAAATDIFGITTTSSPVAVTLVGNPLPSVSLTAPNQNAVFFEHTNITLLAQATDLNGSIQSVQFFAGTNSLGQTTNSPFNLVWTNVPVGSYALTAVATDNQGDSAVSTPINVTIVTNKWPLPKILSPTNGVTFFTPSNVTVSATASDPDGFITLLELYDGAVKLSQTTATNLFLTLTNPPAGTHVLTLRATDNWFTTSTSAPVSIVISNPLPSIAITNPTSGSIFLEATNITIRTKASDTNGSVASVEFFAGTNSLGIVTNTPFSLAWSNVSLGSYALTALAIDNEGGGSTSAPVNITVVTNKLPTVSITTPTNGATFFSASNFTVTAVAADNDGTITSLEIFDGAIKLAQSSNSPLSHVITNAAIGVHTFSARAADNWFGTNTSSPVIVTIANPAPSIAITNPINGANYLEHTNITILARASDTNGTISAVEFFANTNSLGVVTNNPFNIVWSNVPLGSFSLTAVAIDNEGASTVSAPISINVVTNKIPLVSIFTPTNGATFLTSSNFTVIANAWDSDGVISLLELFDGTNKISQSSSSSLSFVVTNASIGTHTFTARASDNWFGTNISSGIIVTVTNPPPSIAITNLVNGATYLEHTNLPILVRAADTNGSVTMVELFADTNLLAVVTNAPFSFVWTNIPLGTYTLSARAIDNEGVSTLSSAITINVISNQLPSVSIVAPTNGATFANFSTISITATASDADGALTRLEVFDGTNKLGQSSTSPLNLTWSNVTAGVHILTARAIDNWSGTNVSAATTITVLSNLPPTVSIVSPTNGSTFFSAFNISVTATASGNNATITLLELFDGASKLTQTTNGSLIYVWTNASIGSHTLAARATDSQLTSNTSAPISIVVTNPPPSVAITNPPAGSLFIETSNILIKAQASDVNGTIAKVDFFAGSTRLGQATVSPFDFIWTNVTAGDYALTAWATDNNGASNVSAAVNISVTNPPPFLAITNPINGSFFLPNSNIVIKATAIDTNGTVAKVEFFSGPNRLGQITNSPFNFTWTNVPVGNYSLMARATDNKGASNNSAIVNITVSPNNAPTATILSPASGSVFITPTNISITASGSDIDGTITLLEIFDSSTRLAQSTNSPMTFVWTNASLGLHTLTARATDNRAISGTSGGIVINVSNPPPLVVITNPLNGAKILTKNKIYIQARASDANGTIAKVQFFAGSKLLATESISPYSYTWNNAQPGSYILTAIATDNLGATNRSPDVAITVARSFPAVREPTPTDPARFEFPVATEFNQTYTVESAENLAGANWLFLTNFPGTGDDVLVSDFLTNQYRFYRVKVGSQ